MDLTGKWKGHYFNNWNGVEFRKLAKSDRFAFAIELEVVQEGSQIRGTMTDLRPCYEMSAREQFELLSPVMTLFEKVKAKMMLSLLRNLVIRTNLPAASFVEGHIEGNEFSFTKVYEGQVTTTFVTNGKETSQVGDLLPILYEGTVSKNGLQIEGIFHVVGKKGPSEHGKGQFLLRRTV